MNFTPVFCQMPFQNTPKNLFQNQDFWNQYMNNTMGVCFPNMIQFPSIPENANIMQDLMNLQNGSKKIEKPNNCEVLVINDS